MKKAEKVYQRFLGYSLIGVVGVTLDFVSFLLLTQFLGVNYLIANSVSTSLGITNNFFLNAFLNFSVRDQLLKRFAIFYSVGILGLAISSLLLYVLIDLADLSSLIAKLITTPIVTLVQFNLNRHYSFRQSL